METQRKKYCGRIGQTVFGAGDHIYRCNLDWVKWPESLRGIHVLNGQFDKTGKLIVATDQKDTPLIEIDKNGDVLRSFGQGHFRKAHSVFLTPENTVLCADSDRSMHVIREVALDGTLVRTFGTEGVPGDSGYDFNYLSILEASDSVPDDPVWNKRPELNARLDSIRRRGKPFCRPCAMAMDSKGRYYAADGYGNAAVHRFSKDGEYECSWGEPGRGPGKFRLVHDIHIDVNDRIWIADRENACVHVMDQDGKILCYISEGLFRVGSIWGDKNYIYIGELDGGVSIVNMEMEIIAQFGYEGSLLHAHGITGDVDGNLYIFSNKASRESNIVKLERLY